MATADQYAEWILANKDKEGTPQFQTFVQAYRDAQQQEQAALSVTPDEQVPPSLEEVRAWMAANPDKKFTPEWNQALNAELRALEAERGPDVPESTFMGSVGGIARGIGPEAMGAAVGGAIGGPPGAALLAGGVGAVRLGGELVVPVLNWGLRNLGIDRQVRTPTEMFNAMFDAMGLEVPDTTVEKMGMALAEGFGQPAAIAKGAAKAAAGTVKGGVPERVMGVLAEQPGVQAASGAAALGTGTLAGEAGLPPAAQLGIGLAAGGGTGFVGARGARKAPVPSEEARLAEHARMAKQAAKGKGGADFQDFANQAELDKARVEAAKRLGVKEEMLPEDIAGSEAFIDTVGGAKGRIQAAKAVDRADQARDDALARVADDIIAKNEGISDIGRVSDEVFERLKTLHDKLENRATQLYKEVDRAIPAQTEVGRPDNVLDYIDLQEVRKGKGAPERLSPALQKMRKRMTVEEVDPDANVRAKMEELGLDFDDPRHANIKKQIGTQVPEVEKPVELTYHFIDEERKLLNQGLFKNTGPYRGIVDEEEAILSQLLLKDQRATLELHPDKTLLKRFDRAQELSKRKFQIREDLKKLYGIERRDGEIVPTKAISERIRTAVENIAAGDERELINILKRVPRTQRTRVLVSSLSEALNVKKARGEKAIMDGLAFNRWYERLKSNPKAFDALMSGLPKNKTKLPGVGLPKNAARRLKDLYTLTSGVEKAAKARNPRNLKAVSDAVMATERLLEKLYGITAKIAFTTRRLVGREGAAVAAPVYVLSSTLARQNSPSMQLVSEMVTNPVFVHMARNPTAQSVKTFVKTGVFKKFMDKVGPRAPTSPERWILNTLQATKDKGQEE